MLRVKGAETKREFGKIWKESKETFFWWRGKIVEKMSSLSGVH